MTRAHLLRLSWIVFVLFGCSAAKPRRYGHPDKHNAKNLFDPEEKLEMSLSFDDASSYDPVSSKPNQVLSAARVETLELDWSRGEEPLVFPRPNYQPSPPAQPVRQPPFNSGASDGMNTSPSAIGAGKGQNVRPYPSKASGSGSGVGSQQGTNVGVREGNVPHMVYENVFQYPPTSQQSQTSNIAGDTDSQQGTNTFRGNQGNVPHLVYEQVFQYPQSSVQSQSSNSAPAQSTSSSAQSSRHPSAPTKRVSHPWDGLPVRGGKNLYSGSKGPRPQKGKNPSQTKRASSAQGTSRAFPSSYIIQSRSGYKRRAHFLSRSKYEPEFAPPATLNNQPVKMPASKSV